MLRRCIQGACQAILNVSKCRTHRRSLLPETPVGYFEYSDLSMVREGRPALSSMSSGSEVTEYLESYADRYDLTNKIRTDTDVRHVSRSGGLWHLTLACDRVLLCAKLIVSTGLCSTPSIPKECRPTQSFEGLVFHTAELAKHYEALVSEKTEEVVIVGGCNSSIDAVCLCMAAGKKVHWIVRRSGTSPGMIIMTDKNKAYVVAVNATRIINALTPSVFAGSGFLYTLLHSGRVRVGKMLTDLYWRQASAFVANGPGYHASSNGMKLSPPHNDLFWNRGCLTLVDSQSGFLDYLHNNDRLEIHDDPVERLSDCGVHLAGGKVIKADVVVCATGWQKSSSLFDEQLAFDLGLPGSGEHEPAPARERWSSLAEAATSKIASMFPKLSRAPDKAESRSGLTPYCLYRNIVPAGLAARNDRSIAFTGAVITSQTFTFAELSGLYAVAYLENLMPRPLPSLENMETDIALVNAWSQARYGSRAVDEQLNFNERAYFDALCQDLGIDPKRKTGSKRLFRLDRTFQEYFTPYRPKDWSGLVEEFLRNARRLQCARAPSSDLSKTHYSATAKEITESVQSQESRLPGPLPLCYRIYEVFRL